MLSAPGDSGGSAPPRSRPPLQMEAYSRYDEITVEAAAWVKRAGLRVRPSVQANVRALVGKAAALPTAEQRELLASMRRWRGWAATMTGWQALYTPRAACPVCEAPELRVNLSNQAAVCVACGSTWAADTIGILADHIAGQQSAHERVPIKSTVAGHGAWTTRRS